MAEGSSLLDVETLHLHKDEPPLRESDIDHMLNMSIDYSPTRYEKTLAAPADGELQGYWTAWAVVGLTAGLFTLVVFLGVVSSRKARKHCFNLYLIYLMIPDLSFSLLCGITCLLNAAHGSYWSHWMCNFQQWYCVWGIGSNCWLNAVITRELHKLVLSSRHGQRYILPSRETVTCQALGVYLYCAFLGFWGLFDFAPHFPYHAVQISGLACIPVEADFRSTLFFWLFFMPIFSVIPILYVIYVSFDIWRRQLLPPSGKRRLLAVYFGRIVIVFLLMWGPYFLLNYLLAAFLPTWVIFAAGTLSHLQRPISASVCLLKPDIYHAVRRFVACQSCRLTKEDERYESDRSSSFYDRNTSLLVMSSFLSRRLFAGSGVDRHEDRERTDALPGEQISQDDESAVAWTCTSVWPNDDGEFSRDEDEEEEQPKNALIKIIMALAVMTTIKYDCVWKTRHRLALYKI